MIRIGERRRHLRRRQAVARGPLTDLLERALDPVRDESRVGAVLDHRGRPGPGPRCAQRAHAHVPHVEGPRLRGARGGVRVGIPFLEAGVEVQDAVIVAPRQDVLRADVPREVQQQITRTDVSTEDLAQGVLADLVHDEARAGGDGSGERRAQVEPVEDGDAIGAVDEVVDQQRDGAARDRTGAEDEDAATEARVGQPGCHPAVEGRIVRRRGRSTAASVRSDASVVNRRRASRPRTARARCRRPASSAAARR